MCLGGRIGLREQRLKTRLFGSMNVSAFLEDEDEYEDTEIKNLDSSANWKVTQKCLA